MSERMWEELQETRAERNALRARVGSLEEMLADAGADVAVAIAERDRLRAGLEALRDNVRVCLRTAAVRGLRDVLKEGAMGLREDVDGVRRDIATQIRLLRELGSCESVRGLELVDSQLAGIARAHDESAASAAAAEREAHEVFFHATRLVAISAIFGRAAINRALEMIWSAALDDLEDDLKDADGNIVERRGEDAAALMSILRMIERRSDPEAWHQKVLDDIEDPEVGVVICDETVEWLRKHYGAKS